MSLEDLMTETVTIVHRGPGAKDAHGDQPLAETGRDEGVPCYAEQTDGSEVTRDRDVQIADRLFIVPAGQAVDGRALILYGGETYEVVGPPERPVAPGRGEHHVEIRARHAEV